MLNILLLFDGFSFEEFVVAVGNNDDDDGGGGGGCLLIRSAILNLDAFGKKDLVGVVVVGGNVFVIVVCGGGGGGTAADAENWNDGIFDDNGGGGCGLATFVEKNGRFELAVAVVGKRIWTGGCWTECGTGGGWEDGGGWETGIGCWDI